MKRISVFLAPIFILSALYGCSKDHDSPSFSAYEKTAEPTDVVATYDKAKDAINVTWTMANIDGIDDYLVAWSDSNLFDAGKKYNQYVKKAGDTDLKAELSLDATYLLEKMDLTYADKDSFIVYFTVSAVYNNEEFTYFVGPRAVVERTGTFADSALVLR